MATDTPVLLICPGCKKKYKVPHVEPGRTYRCKECKGPLSPEETKNQKPETSKIRLEGEPEDRVWDIPVRLGRYKIEAELGRGAMGVVYKGRQEGLDRAVAIKMILGGAASNAEMITRFKREARAAAKLKHPSIVAIHEIGEYNGLPFFTMEYVEGKALDQMMSEGGPMPFQKAARIMRDVSLAVDHAHQHHIIHRDIKPPNILVDKAGLPHITDFGLAKDLNSQSILSMTGDIMGTPGYMAPEQAEGLVHELDGRVDVYAIGACLYRLICGKPPFEGPTVATTIYALVNEIAVDPVKLNPKVPPDLSAVTMKALEKDPKDRYATAKELADDLDNFLHGRHIGAKQVGKSREMKLSWKKHKRWIVLAIAAILLGASTVAGILLLTSRYLDEVEKNLANPAVAPQSFKTLLIELDRFKGAERSRALDLASKYMAAHPDVETRKAVLDVAEVKGVPDELLPPLRTWVAQEEPPELCIKTIRYLAARPDKGATGTFIDRLQSANKEIKREGVRALAKIPDLRAYGPLGALMTDPFCGADAREALSKFQALDSLMILSGAPGSSTAATLAAIAGKIDAHNQAINEIIGDDGQKKDKVQLTIDALSSPVREERMAAATLLGPMKDARAVEPLAALVERGDDAAMNAADSLVAIGTGMGADRLRPLLKHESPLARRAAAYLIGAFGELPLKPALLEALGAEKDQATKEMMASTIAKLP